MMRAEAQAIAAAMVATARRLGVSAERLSEHLAEGGDAPPFREQCGCPESRKPDGGPCGDPVCWDELWHPAHDVHIERMDDGLVWMRVGEYHLNLYARRKGVLEVTVDEVGWPSTGGLV